MNASRSFSLLLANGGRLYANKTSKGSWSVDVFDADAGPTDEPTYHAYYSGPDAEADARANAASWVTWDERSAALKVTR